MVQLVYNNNNLSAHFQTSTDVEFYIRQAPIPDEIMIPFFVSFERARIDSPN
jgi:hypothetical protein